MEQDTKRLGKIILWEVSLVFVIVLIVRYFRSYTQLEDRLQELFFEIMPPSLMIIFVLILVVGFVYEWKKGELEWQ